MLFKFLILFAFVAGSLGFPVEEEVFYSEEERGIKDWFKTPFKEVKVECHPEASKVLCNFESTVVGMKLNGGFATEFNAKDKTVNVKIILNGETRFSKDFSYNNLDKLCYAQPVPVVGELEVCLFTKVTQKENKDIVACPKVLFYLDKKSFEGDHWAEIIFNCPTLTATGISWTRPIADKDGSDALKDQKYLRFKTHDAVKKGLKYSTEKVWEIVNTYFIKKSA